MLVVLGEAAWGNDRLAREARLVHGRTHADAETPPEAVQTCASLPAVGARVQQQRIQTYRSVPSGSVRPRVFSLLRH